MPLTGLYPLADWPSREPRSKDTTRAKPTGEFRPPKRGEWYLSGAIVEAYRAPHDLTTPFHIAQLVRVRVVHRVEEVS